MQSPYTTRAVIVSIGASGAKYTVLQAIVDQYPGLTARLDPKSHGALIELPEVDEDIGHTLIHYIYTTRYETLPLGSVPDDVKTATEFKRSVLAYCAAKLCGIATMEETTKAKMEEYRKGLSVFDLQLTAEEVSSKLPRSNDWFSEQIHKWIKDELVADVTLFTEGKILGVIGRSAIFDRACVKSIGELYSELLADRPHPVVNGDGASHEKESTSGSSEVSNVTESKSHFDFWWKAGILTPPKLLIMSRRFNRNQSQHHRWNFLSELTGRSLSQMGL